jgi:hypothetical protein
VRYRLAVARALASAEVDTLAKHRTAIDVRGEWRALRLPYAKVLPSRPIDKHTVVLVFAAHERPCTELHMAQ